MPSVHPPPSPNAAPELLYLLHGDPVDLAEALSGMRAADVAEALRDLHPDGASKVMAALPFDLAVQVFDEPELEGHRCAIVQQMNDQAAGPLIEAMSSDQQADLFRELPEANRARFLKLLAAPTRGALRLLLAYPPETAAGIMTTEFVSMPTTWTVDRALKYISEVGRAKETVYAIYLLDPADGRLLQVVSLRDLMLAADRSQPVSDVGNKRVPLRVTPLTDREDVARLISKYNLLAVPVVDDTGRVLGIVTVDDVIDAIVREQTEDVQKFGGMEALDEPYTEITFGRMIRKRAGWLCALFLGEMLTATAMGHFEGEIAKAVVLSLFIPLIISSGGNSGSQATSLIIRALALREVRLGDWWRIAMRELPAGLALGLILGAIGIVRIVVWQKLGWYDYGTHWALVAGTVGGALVGVVTFGSLAGSMLPFLLKRLGFDPASASAPFVATLVDVTGLVIYFSVAFAILRGTLL
ncbi:MAG: magnesium transporter [Gemmatimonadaceae bacterium]|nr:magnesium transporter [Gemmatimonadaceae bacterium]NUS48440.1 magnesium transporter [Gemmatimonadaceae bacterium]